MCSSGIKTKDSHLACNRKVNLLQKEDYADKGTYIRDRHLYLSAVQMGRSVGY